jgi:hypothetical protein
VGLWHVWSKYGKLSFSIFALPENMKAWEQGKNDAEIKKLNEVSMEDRVIQ